MNEGMDFCMWNVYVYVHVLTSLYLNKKDKEMENESIIGKTKFMG